MSSKAKRIEENVEIGRKLKLHTLYGSLAGSIIVTIGKLVGKTEDDMLKDFAKLSVDEEFYKCGNIREACDYVANYYKMPESYKDYIILVYDDGNLYTPVVTLLDEDGYIQPLNRDGEYLGILANYGKKESIKFEEIYSEE